MYTEHMACSMGSGKIKDKIRMIAIDMDGTLLRSDKTIDTQTIRDIEDADRKGIIVAYCTGRAVPELSFYTDILHVMRYGICMSGALIYDFVEKRGIYKRTINQRYVREIIRAAVPDDAMVHFLTETESIVRKDQLYRMAEYNMGIYQPMYEEIAKTADDLSLEMKKHESVLKANVHFHSEGARKEAYDILKDFPLSFVFSETTTLEITASGVTKATGLSILSKCMGIPLENVMGIGDGNNDTDMLRSAGFSVAMGNSRQELKDICSAVTEDNDHNGVGEAIRRYCL